MSLSHTAAEYMLSDALLPDPSSSRAKGLRLELPSDRVLKFIAVGLPIFLVSLAFAREFSAGSQISCFSPSNFTGKQSAYADTACWDSLLHHGFDAEGRAVTKSLWALKVFPYSLLVVAVLMYLPYLLWRYAASPALHSDLLFIIDELDKSYNRSVRLVQHMRKVQQASDDPEQFWEEYERARQESALQLCQWDKGLLSVYEMLPAFDLLSRKMLTCPINDLNVILLFLRANISELSSFSRLNAVSALRGATAEKQDIDTVVDFMTLLAGLEATKPKYQACMPPGNGEAIEMKPGVEAKDEAAHD